MSTDMTVPDTHLTTIQQIRIAKSTLRYARIGLIDAVLRDDSSGHRRYPPDLVSIVESLSCGRGSGLSMFDMRVNVAIMAR